MKIHEFRITEQNKFHFEKLLGFKINAETVKITDDFYNKKNTEINQILQLSHNIEISKNRIKTDEYRKPRAVIIDIDSKNNMRYYGELTITGFVTDTTLTDIVLSQIDKEINSGKNAGSVIIDEIEYAFIVGTTKSEK